MSFVLSLEDSGLFPDGMILEDTPVITGSCVNDFAFSSPLTEQQQKGSVRESVSSCLKFTFAKPKNRGREDLIVFYKNFMDKRHGGERAI